MMAARGNRALAGWALLLLAAVAFIALQLQAPHEAGDAHDGHAADAPQMLLSAPLTDWAAIDLLQRGQRQGFARDAQGQWLRHAVMAGEAADHAHRSDPAEAERIGAVLATLSRTRIERTLPADPAQAAAFGLDNPALIVLVQGRDGRVLQTLEFGDLAADGLSRYVQVPQTRQVHTVPHYQLAGLLGLLVPAAGPAASAPAGPLPGDFPSALPGASSASASASAPAWGGSASSTRSP